MDEPTAPQRAITTLAAARARARDPRATLKLAVTTGAVVVAAVVLFVMWLSEHQRTSTLSAQLGSVQSQLGQVQTAQNQAATSAQALADQVRSLGKTPVVNPPAPLTGPAGRGITATAIREGHLIVTYSDGSTTDAGLVAGQTGMAGVSITSALIVGGDLVLTYSDGHTADVGQVVGAVGPQGAAGEPGKDGTDGRSVTSVANNNGHLIVTYSDGTTQDAGPLPVGPAGPPGPAGADAPRPTKGEFATLADGTCVYRTTYSDGTVLDAPTNSAMCLPRGH